MSFDGPLGRLMLSRSDLDRAAEQRSDENLIASLLDDPGTRILDLHGGQAQLRTDGGHCSLVLRPPSPDDLQDLADGQALWIFLGRDHDGVGYLARVSDRLEEAQGWQGLREAGALLDDRDAGLFTCALALANWHATHPHCPRCGAITVPAMSGWTRRCTADGSEHYPRTDPAIIVAVRDEDDRLLLGHNAVWPEGRFSTLAGFVEPGESLEDAVRREVYEEAGILVGEVTFLASQPWPFPASLMLGCSATAISTDIQVDSHEVSEARWFTRPQLAEEIISGRVTPPGGVSIARRLVEKWFGGPIPQGPNAW